MAQLKTKFLENDAVDSTKVRIENGAFLRGRNVADSGDVNMLEMGADDLPNLLAGAKVGGSVILKTSDKGAANGVASLDGSSKIPAAQLPASVMDYKGAHNASTNSPAIIDGTGDLGDLYRVSVGATRDYGSGNITLAAGDALIYSGSVWEKIPSEDLVQSVNGAVGVVVLDTDDIGEGVTNLYYTQARFDSAFAAKDSDGLSEGSTNLYFTNGRAQSAVVTQVITNGVTITSPSEDAVFDALALKIDLAGDSMDSAANLTFSGGGEVLGLPASPSVDGAGASKKYVDDQVAAASGSAQFREVITLSAAQITAQKVVLAATPIASSVILSAEGVAQTPGVDFTELAADITFAGDLATGGNAELVAGDVLVINYES